MTRDELAAVAFLPSMLAVIVLIVALPSGPAALPQSPQTVQAAPPGALSAPPLATCRALDIVSEADCLNRCLMAEIDFVFYHSSNGVLCMVPCALAVGGAELKGY